MFGCDTFVMIVYSHRQYLFGIILPNDIIIQEFLDFYRLKQIDLKGS